MDTSIGFICLPLQALSIVIVLLVCAGAKNYSIIFHKNLISSLNITSFTFTFANILSKPYTLGYKYSKWFNPKFGVFVAKISIFKGKFEEKGAFSSSLWKK
jgi:hypothetical protein